MKRLVLAALITTFFSIPEILYASTSIFLSENDRKLVDQGEIVVREAGTDSRPGKTFEAIGFINASKNSILQVLTAYEKYPEFMPNVSSIDMVEKTGEGTVLNYTLTLPLGKIKKYRLVISVSENDENTGRIRWRKLEWPGLKTSETIRDTTGYWFIEEKAKNRSLVLYHVYTDPGPIPLGLGWIVDVLSKDSVPEALLQTKARAENISSTGGWTKIKQ